MSQLQLESLEAVALTSRQRSCSSSSPAKIRERARMWVALRNSMESGTHRSSGSHGRFLHLEDSSLRILGKRQRVLGDHAVFSATFLLRERKEKWLEERFPSPRGGVDLLWKRSASEMTSTTRNGSIESLSYHGARHVSATASLAALPDSAASRR